MAHDPTPDLSSACWRCKHWGGLVAQAHASCTRDGYLQANAATGCAFWAAGPGGQQPAGWLPDGFRMREKTMIWGDRAPASDRPPIPAHDGRYGTPSEVAAWDRRQEREAWRATDALMARAARRVIRAALLGLPRCLEQVILRRRRRRGRLDRLGRLRSTLPRQRPLRLGRVQCKAPMPCRR